MNCPVCGNDIFSIHRVIDSAVSSVPEGLDRPLHVRARVERCTHCGLYRTIPLSDDRQADQLYHQDSVSHRASASKVSVSGATSTSSSDELALLANRPPASLLDVGCGAGQFLLKATAAGYAAQGIDPDPRSVAFATTNLGLNVREGSLEVLAPSERFDIITTLGVLEHIEEPAAFLTQLRDKLNPNGEILVGVPNVGSLNRRISRLSSHDWDMFLEPGHLYHYSQSTLAKLGTNAELIPGNSNTATLTIRGKIPLMPTRLPKLEHAIRNATRRSPIARRAYISALRLLDSLNQGDMLFMVFRAGE